jgi:two-component system sensor histidine kinase MtrB
VVDQSTHADLCRRVAELERQVQLQAQFIALASHELRTPAAVIHGVAATLAARAGALAPERVEQLTAALVEHTERMSRLLDELLDLSRLDANMIEIDPRPLGIRERAHEIVRAVAGDSAPAIAIDVPPELAPPVDVTAFDRIVSNLVANALSYGAAPISITAAQTDRHFRLTVEDRGAGVSAEFVPRLFDRFTREERAEPRKGSGLGLSIAQAYAHAHGGHVFYEDASPRGARFQLVLPSRPPSG